MLFFWDFSDIHSRLKKNGVISAEHPMHTMQQEGRFEELSDDDSD